LRDIAKQVVEIAELPVMAERREMWRRHNRLERVRPMILVYPEGSWNEIIPKTVLQCETDLARQIEWSLRVRIAYHEYIHDDTAISKDCIINKVITHTGWGVNVSHLQSSEEKGAWKYDPVIKTPQDLKTLRYPEILYDEKTSLRDFEHAQEVVGDILNVRLTGVRYLTFQMMQVYCDLRGLEQVMIDMYEEPGMLHDAMAFLEEGHRRIVKQYEDLNLLTLNNDWTYQSSGGVGFTDELPKADFDPNHVRPCDMWASAESQEMAQVSPQMHYEFAMQYEKRLLAPFGLAGYGCCDPLHDKLDYVLQIPNIRRISISPWANVEKSAEILRDNYIFSWKPHPAYLSVGSFNGKGLREYIQRTLDVTKECVIEMILADTHTCQNDPRRFTQWTDIARDVVDSYA
jgi:hypothetical protein